MSASHDNQDLLFFDDFTSTRLDRSKWNVEITGGIVNDEQQVYVSRKNVKQTMASHLYRKYQTKISTA